MQTFRKNLKFLVSQVIANIFYIKKIILLRRGFSSLQYYFTSCFSSIKMYYKFYSHSMKKLKLRITSSLKHHKYNCRQIRNTIPVFYFYYNEQLIAAPYKHSPRHR